MKKTHEVSDGRERLEMDEVEKKRFQMLPLRLRQRIAALLRQPELIPPDGRRTRSAALRAAKTYAVFTPENRKTRLCSLDEALAYVDCSKADLEAFFNQPLTVFVRKHVYTESTRFGDITISRAEPK